MREAVPFLDTAAMDWSRLAPGVYSKVLSRDPATGERTALQRIVPADDYVNQPRAHFHHTTEEILVVDGMMSFDSRTWLHRAAYVFHPAETVHGFNSTVPVETQFLSRVGRALDFNYVDEPADDYPYDVGAKPPSRALALEPCPFGKPWTRQLDDSGRPFARYLPLSVDPVTGEGSYLFRYEHGTLEPESVAGPLAHYHEMFVLEGTLEADDGRRFSSGCYAFQPPGARRPRFKAAPQTLVYVNVGPGSDPLPGSSAPLPAS